MMEYHEKPLIMHTCLHCAEDDGYDQSQCDDLCEHLAGQGIPFRACFCQHHWVTVPWYKRCFVTMVDYCFNLWDKAISYGATGEGRRYDR